MQMLFLLEAAPDLELLGANLIKALIPILVPLLVWGVRSILPKIPKAALPILSPILGALLDALLAYIAGGQWSPIAGAALGAAGVGLREIVDQLNKSARSKG